MDKWTCAFFIAQTVSAAGHSLRYDTWWPTWSESELHNMAAVNFFQIVARFVEWNDTSYPRKVNEGKANERIENVEQTELTLDVPSMRDRVKVSFPNDALPVNTDKLDQWESDEPWLVIFADGYRNNAFDGKKGASAIMTFNGVDVREVNTQEKAELTKTRKDMKNKAKQRRAKAKAERDAEKAAEQSAKPAA